MLYREAELKREILLASVQEYGPTIANADMELMKDWEILFAAVEDYFRALDTPT